MIRNRITLRGEVGIGLCMFVALTMITMPAAPVAAQEVLTGPSQTYDLNAGPYPVHVIIWGDPVRTQHAASVEIVPSGGMQRNDLKVQAALVPGPGVAASIIPLPVRPSDSNTTSLVTQITPQERGSFILRLNVSGPQGIGTGDVRFSVQGPPAIPAWAGWLVGLLPLAGLALFVAHEIRKSRAPVRGTPITATAAANAPHAPQQREA